MTRVIRPWQVLVVAAAGWISRHLNDLATKGKTLGYRVLSEVATIVMPDTIPRWHRQFA